MNNFHAGWYLIYTRPRHEKKVHARLTEMKINSFLPTQRKLRHWHDRKKFVEEPLFPSYVFTYLNDRQNYYEVMDTEGTLYYVKSGKEIARVNESVVNNIKLVTSQAKDLEVSENSYQVGKRLVISKGPLTGLNCEVVECGIKQKLLVRVDLLQRNLLVSIPTENLMAI